MNKSEIRLLVMSFCSFLLFRQLDTVLGVRGFEIFWGIGMLLLTGLIMATCVGDFLDHIGKDDE